GARDRPVPSHLVEVHEHPLAALLLPPTGRHQVGAAAFEFAGEGDHGPARLHEGPLWTYADVDVQTSTAGGLRPAGEAQLLQDRAQLAGRLGGGGEVGAGLRVEVDPQLVGAVRVGAADRPRVEHD